MNLIRYIRLVLLSIVVCLIAYSYHPSNFGSSGELINTTSGKYAIMLIAMVFVLSLDGLKGSILIKPIRLYFLMLGGISLIFAAIYAIGLTDSFYEIRALTISFIALLLGSSIKLNNKEIIFFSLVFSIATIVIGYLQITQNIGDFTIYDSYVSAAKNAFGPIITTSGILLLLIAFNPSCNVFTRAFFLAISILSLIEVATIRARLATIIFLILAFYIIIKYVKSINNQENKGIYYLIISIVTIISFFVLWEYIWESLTLNKEDDFSSGRLGTYYDSIDIFTKSPLLGNLILNEDIAWVHNYILLKLSEYGLIISVPLFILYFYLVTVIWRGLKSKNLFVPKNYGYILITISFISSMGEPTFPYGPGTTCFLPFFMLGIAMKYNSTKVTKKK